MGFNAREVVRAGREVYERHRAECERLHPGKYLLIDIRTGRLFLAESPEDAYRRAAAEHQEGPFHLLRIGDRAAYRSRRVLNGADTRITR
jgi:hypothetical protein